MTHPAPHALSPRRRARRSLLQVALVSAVTAAVFATFVPTPAEAADGGRGVGRMGKWRAGTTTVRPSAGPDFELPFQCGSRWVGSTRRSHSPSSRTVDFNASGDLGKPVVASAPGVVVSVVSLRRSYGNYVVIDHGSGFTSLYAHLLRHATAVGTVLDQGDLVGYVGSSGNSTGPHLHFEERKNSRYFTPYSHRVPIRFGVTYGAANCGDRPLGGDWDGDGVGDVGVYRPTPAFGEFRLSTRAGVRAFALGTPGDQPLVGDWDGDGSDEVGVRRLGTDTFVLRDASGALTSVRFGLPSDQPVTGDWDGDGRTDIGVYRATTRAFYLRAADGSHVGLAWGGAGDQPVTGDWNGDGRTDLGTFNRATGHWSLRLPRGASYSATVAAYGLPGDLPVTGDWNGDRRSDLAVWRPADATFWLQGGDAPSGRVTTLRSQVFGNPRG